MMKRSLGSSDSLGARISICPSTGTDPSPTEEHSPGSGSKHVYSSREWRLDDDDEEGAMEEVREKKRRLSVEQVKALEKHFEVENKLEPERKTKLAQELGLQPRQVAVWFQNRRARWKTKQLEKDYGALKSSFDSLQHDFHSLHQQNESLKQQIRDLKSTTAPVKEEHEAPVATTDSDSSAVLNSPNHHTHRLTYFNLSESAAGGGDEVPFVKMEEHDFLGEEGCNFFPEDEAPSLHWYCSPDDQWTS